MDEESQEIREVFRKKDKGNTSLWFAGLSEDNWGRKYELIFSKVNVLLVCRRILPQIPGH